MVIRSTNNLPDAKTLMAGYLNIRDLLTFDKLILPVQIAGCACSQSG